MPAQTKVFGILTPKGGGDPIPLLKDDLIVGRRASCDICLDFHNVSGKHCRLRLINQVWHVRDLASTNGTTLNGGAIVSEHTVMPDDEVGFATHLFTIDYEPGGPQSLIEKDNVLHDEEFVEGRKRHSLMELAGLDTDDDKPKHRSRPDRAPALIERLSADEAEFDDALPEHVKAAPLPAPEVDEEDFLKSVEEDLKKSNP